jgi:hypothetical protein
VVKFERILIESLECLPNGFEFEYIPFWELENKAAQHYGVPKPVYREKMISFARHTCCKNYEETKDKLRKKALKDEYSNAVNHIILGMYPNLKEK